MDGIDPAFQIGPIAFWMILLSSATVFGLAGEQLYTYWNLTARARELAGELGKTLYRGDLQAARTICERSSSPVADIFIAALNKVNHPGESVDKAAERERQRLSLWMKRRLWAIGTVGATAPFVGLFGTVVGIIRAFKDIAAAGSGGFSVVAAGVSEALVATAGGIFVAVIAVVLYNYFQSRGNHTIVEVRLIIDEFLEQLESIDDRTQPPRSSAVSGETSVPEIVQPAASES